jgi:hypothetical protein
MERQAQGGGTAESLLDPVGGVGLGVREGEKVKQDGAGGGFLEIGREGGGEVAELEAGVTFVFGIGGEELEAGAAGKGTGGGHAG